MSQSELKMPKKGRSISNINLELPKQIWLFTLSVLAISMINTACSKHNRSDETMSTLPTVVTVKAQLLSLDKELDLPGQLEAYQNVPVHAKVEGFISWIGVDRGSIVKKGQKLMTVFCPELEEKTKEGAAKMSAAEASYRQSESGLQNEIAKLLEARAKLDADSLTYSRLKEAAKTPGAIAQNEVDLAEKTVEADAARVKAGQAAIDAAKALVTAENENFLAAQNLLKALEDMKGYLTITAPFDGVITERNVHNGSIVAIDPLRNAQPLVRIQEKDLLRLVVAVPEDCTAGLKNGAQIAFTVPAFIGKTFYGTIARLGYALDIKTRTMPVELNAWNPTGELEPGMFATVKWHVLRPYKTIFLLASAVGSDLRGTFVIRVKNGIAERLTVRRGLSMNELVEVVGDVSPDDEVALKATDELKSGTRVVAQLANQSQIESARQNITAEE